MPNWRWLNETRIFEALDRVPDEQIDALLYYLEELLADPLGTKASPMRGKLRHNDRFIAPLPFGWYIAYTPHLHGIPEITDEPVLLVRAMYPFLEPGQLEEYEDSEEPLDPFS